MISKEKQAKRRKRPTSKAGLLHQIRIIKKFLLYQHLLTVDDVDTLLRCVETLTSKVVDHTVLVSVNTLDAVRYSLAKEEELEVIEDYPVVADSNILADTQFQVSTLFHVNLNRVAVSCWVVVATELESTH